MSDPAIQTPIWRTLRFRFALWTAVLVLLVLIGFGLFVYLSMARSLSEAVDNSLQLNASQALNMVEVESGNLELPDTFVEGDETANLRSHGFVLRILNSEGHMLHEDGSYPELPLPPDSIEAARQQQTHLTTLTDPASGDLVRVFTTPILDHDRLIGIYQVGQAITDVHETLNRLLRVLLIGTPVLVIIAGASGYFLAAHALAPIDSITRTANRISAEDLSARLNLPPADDEVGRLASTFDRMLSRLDEAFQRERRFTADASHELRTPLAAMQAILDVTREKRRTPAQYEQALQDVSDEAERLRVLAENLLLLARGDAQTPAQRKEIDLSMLLTDIVDSLQPLAREKGLNLSAAAPAGLRMKGDLDSLIRLFANLVDNAIKYSERGSIAITSRPMHNDHIAITVADTGIGIAAHDVPHLFERFYRVDKSRTSNGAGLGLAIAQDIARAHGGTIHVDSELGVGSRFIVSMPSSLY